MEMESRSAGLEARFSISASSGRTQPISLAAEILEGGCCGVEVSEDGRLGVVLGNAKLTERLLATNSASVF
ncbi:hypothetical protein NUW54_g6242 [Trametes sanguinea]|uniref:Uncharacterized protein n=1 Tax=Trametes sanguinea TaxID=158606 RepID=A0ACC1PUG9_9APHY|nr:hypothetical protein NUW54_g6242 [Trametes sanguinea]